MNKDVIIGLDFKNNQELNDFLEEFCNEDIYVKVGMELYYQHGPQIINLLKRRGFKIFLDLKLHDIPNTVVKTMEFLKTLNVDIINLHASVGSETLKLVADVFKDSETKVIGVTLLTSTDEKMLKNDLAITLSIDNYVLHLAQLCNDAGLDGVVCSAHEVEMIKKHIDSDFLCITPGIRYAFGQDDQKRVTTPKDAAMFGSDYIVVGRVITQSSERLMMYKQVKNDFLGEYNEL